jgi:hypothetical protein
MSRFRVGVAFSALVISAGVVPVVVTAGGGVATAAPIPGGSITSVCTGTTSGGTFTLTADCGEVTSELTVPPTITTVNGGGFTISATDIGAGIPQFNDPILTNETAGQTMHIENLTVSGPATGFQVCLNSTNLLFGIYFNDAGGTINDVTVEHIWQQQTGAPSCQTGTAIRATGAHTLTITNTKVMDYQKNGIDGRNGMTMDVSGSTIGPPRNLEGLIAANGLVYVTGATGTAKDNTIFGSGDDQLPGPPGGGTDATAVLLFGATNVIVTHNVITGAKTDIGIAVTADSTGNVISFNQVGRTAPDAPDPTGVGILVSDATATRVSADATSAAASDPSNATLICNTFSNWKANVVGAIQISCTPFPDPPCGQAYTSSVLSVEGGTAPFTWSASGTLPPGLSMASSSGTVSGTPTTAGTFHFTAHVADSSSPPLNASQDASITVVGSCSEEAGEPPGLPESSEPGEAPTAPVAPITTTGLAFTG